MIQVACAALTGALCRNAISLPGLEALKDLDYEALCTAMVFAGPGTIMPVLLLAWHADLPPWKKWVVVGIETGLLFTYCLAGLPLVQ